jgi:hypothetical protein
MALLHSCQVTTEQRPVHIQVVVFMSCNTSDSAYFIPRQAVNKFLFMPYCLPYAAKYISNVLCEQTLSGMTAC